MAEQSNPKSIAHNVPLKQLLQILNSKKNGLSSLQVEESRKKWGSNSIAKEKEVGPLGIFLRQFNIITGLLVFSALIAFVIGHALDSVGILAAALLSMFFGFIQEYKAEEALKALYKLSAPKTTVIRDGKDTEIDSELLVCGDVILLSAGDLIPADCRIIEGEELLADQSILTGESEACHKHCGETAKNTILSQRNNLLYAGTLLLKGDTKAVVFAVGKDSEFGAIAQRLSKIEAGKTPLAKSLDELGSNVSKAAILLVCLFFTIGVLRSAPLADTLIVSVSLFVAAIPEGLPTVLAITLAVGVSRMAKEKAIVRKMQAVETMGAVTTICTDKTGTLTQNRMHVVNAYFGTENIDLVGDQSNPKKAKIAIEYAALCSSARVTFSKDGTLLSSIGDAMDVAIILACRRASISYSHLEKEWTKEADFPFEFKKKMASQVRKKGSSHYAFSKGAPEVILSMCTHILDSDMKERLITKEDILRIDKATEGYASSALRTIAVAYRKLPLRQKYTQKDMGHSLVFVSVLGLIDPPREGVAQAIGLCQKAGIRIIMLTGDSAHTARAIAYQLHIIEDQSSPILSGGEIEKMEDTQLKDAFENCNVCARATPEHKFRIVQALQRAGEIVALTGDGVNDAPSIKKADVGIAMGIGGTDVARGAADVILTDNNFGTLVNAISRGRSIFENILSFVRYQFTTNVAAMALMFTSPIFGLPLPLVPLQILWINIIMDGPPALALGAETAKKDIMQNPPRNPSTPILSKAMFFSIFSSAFFMVLITLAVFVYYLQTEPTKALTMSFCTFVFLQLANALNCRSRTLSAFENLFSNKYLLAAILFSVTVQIIIVQSGEFGTFFSAVPINIHDWILVFGASSVLMFYSEISKSLSRAAKN